LTLDGLKTLSVEAARAIARHDGELNLGGLESLCDEAAIALAGTTGKLDLGWRLKTLSAEAAEALSIRDDMDWTLRRLGFRAW
jgi:hypothetical protein